MIAQPLTVHFIGPVRRPGLERKLTIHRQGLHTVEDLLSRLGYSRQEQQVLQVLVDGARRSHQESIEEGRQIEILIAIGGG